MVMESWRVISTEVKEENDLLILFGQWMYIKLKTDMLVNGGQCNGERFIPRTIFI